jgi:cell division protein FtsI (penicillin-binding protein 3)
MRHQASFCGFYPYENPEFSCIVFIRNPRIGNASGGGMAGTVFKEIAERVMASHSLLPISKYPIDTARTIYPKIKNGNFEDAQKVLSALLFR